MKILKFTRSYLLLSFLFFSFFFSANAQQKENRVIIKNSLEIDVFKDVDLNGDDVLVENIYDTAKITSLSFFNPGVIVSTGKYSLHEFEASQLAFSNKDVTVTPYFGDSLFHGHIQEYTEKTFLLGLRYIYHYRISHPGKKIEFYIGSGISYFINSIHKNPTSSHIYPWFARKSNQQRLDISVRPKVMYTHHNMVIDLSFGLSMYQLYSITNTREGSIFTSDPIQIELVDNRFWPGTFNISLGVGYKL